MDEIAFDDGIGAALNSLLHGRLALLTGAGLSMAAPSSLPSAATVAAMAKQTYDAMYGATRPPLAETIEDQAEFFFARGELDTVYFHTLIHHSAFAGRPNQGHYAIADLLLIQAIQTAITTNVDTLVETAGQMLWGQIGACIDGHQAAAQPAGTAPLLKIHGCRQCDRPNMVWALGQIAVPPVSTRIANSATWLNAQLLDRDLLIIGYSTDWDYLNVILSATVGVVNPAHVWVVDVAPPAAFQTKASDLYAIGQRATGGFQYVRASGSEFLDALRREFSRSFIRQLLAMAAQEFTDLTGNAPNAAWMEPPTLDNPTLWQVRGDLEGRLPNMPSTARTPPHEPLLGLTFLQLRSAGAVSDGPYWQIGRRRVRVLRAANKSLHRVQAEYERETPPAIAPDLVIAVGAEAQLLPAHVVRASTVPTIARGSAGHWMTRQEAVVELAL
jgi:NAD-dependent SIR2 family protein deacetylase